VPAIGSPTVRDVTPAEMATKPGPTYHFFRQGTGIPGFRKAVCHPFPPTARRHSGPEWLALPEIARGDARPMTINLKWVFS